MATCRECGNYYIGSFCPFCAAELRHNDPEEIEKIKKESEEEVIKAARRMVFADRWHDSFLFSTTTQLEGYKIKSYHGVVTGSSVLGTGFLSEFKSSFSDFFGTKSKAFSDKIEEVKNDAMQKARDNALLLESNAIVGVDIELTMFSGNIIAAVVSGTAVFIEKE